MKKFTVFFCFLILCCSRKPDDNIQIVLIDGIKHVKNPVEPSKGTVMLELENQVEINPYDCEEVGFRYFQSVKDRDGEVILFSMGQAEAHRFSGTGEYLGSMITQGEGPGEFSPNRIMIVHFIDNQIWVTGEDKLAKFDKSGQFIEEFKINDRSPTFLDNSSYINDIQVRNEEGRTKKIVLKRITAENTVEELTTFMEMLNVGMIRDGKSGFADSWGTPDLEYAADSKFKKVYVVYSPEYKIYAKDLEGNTLYVIERPYEHVKVSREDVIKLIPWAAKEHSKWILDAYPDHLRAVLKLITLPKGYLGVFRISGVRKAEIDIFDPEGRYVYILKLPEGIELMETAFYDFGFAAIDNRGDMPVYLEYKVKNLPEIFSGR